MLENNGSHRDPLNGKRDAILESAVNTRVSRWVSGCCSWQSPAATEINNKVSLEVSLEQTLEEILKIMSLHLVGCFPECVTLSNRCRMMSGVYQILCQILPDCYRPVRISPTQFHLLDTIFLIVIKNTLGYSGITSLVSTGSRLMVLVGIWSGCLTQAIANRTLLMHRKNADKREIRRCGQGTRLKNRIW